MLQLATSMAIFNNVQMVTKQIWILGLISLLMTGCSQPTLDTNQTPTTAERFPSEANTQVSDQYQLTQFTDVYPHQALGDAFEATQLVDTEASQSTWLISLPDNQVFETNRVLTADFTGDPSKEILLTVSHLDLGAANVIYDQTGHELARTDYLGQRFRWRHLLGVMENESGDRFLVDVVTPHLEGILTLYKLEDNRLAPIFEQAGYPSHTFGSENLNQAYIFRKDGRDILRIPHQDGNDHFLYLEGDRFVLLDK